MKSVIAIANGRVRIVNSGGYDGVYEKYKVVKGDTLGKIAAEYNVTVDALAKINEIENVNLIEVDQVLYVPVKDEAETKAEPQRRVVEIGNGLSRLLNSDGVDGVYKKYVVVKGDTLGKIAAENNTTVELLAKVNNIENVNLIEIDQELLVPAEEKKQVEEIKIINKTSSIN